MAEWQEAALTAVEKRGADGSGPFVMNRIHNVLCGYSP